MFRRSDIVVDHAIQLIPGHQETLVVQREAGTLPCTVLDVVGFIQHQYLACQVDLHLVKRGSKRAEVEELKRSSYALILKVI